MSSARVRSIGILLLVILGLPPLGILLSGQALPSHLTHPPIPTQPGDASLSWPIFGVLAMLIVGTLVPFWRRFNNTPCPSTAISSYFRQFPWWGWAGITWTALMWILAWTRFSWFQEWQANTFPLLWFGYIVVINALKYSRTGRCLLINQPGLLVKLFLLSAGFWWMFEYLNQFVHNWHYVGMAETHTVTTIFWMSLSFSTVLPAVLGTYEYLWSFRPVRAPFENWYTISMAASPHIGWGLFSFGALGLLLIGIWPTLLFPLLWISPLLVMVGVEAIRKNPTVLTPLTKGNWSPVVLSALAALICGGFWEMWNAYSLIHWEYSIPYVQTLRIFEMPVLGYAGYLPFGLECLAVVDFFLGYQHIQTRPYAESSPPTAPL